MMDNVRKARTGKKKQAPAVKANRFIPKWVLKLLTLI
jgi:ribosomal protein L39E